MDRYFMGQDGFAWFIGVVEDRADPLKVGRVRVRCLGYHSAKTEDIPTEDLPWASVMMPVTAGGNSGIGVSPHFLIEGTWVMGFFRDPAKQEPVIMGALPGFNSTSTANSIIASSGGNEKGGGTSKGGGFRDPKGVYPTETYLDQSDTNLLAQEKNTKHYTYIADDKQTDLFYSAGAKSVKSDNVVQKNYTESWATSDDRVVRQVINSQGKAKYPYNHIFETECGNYVEFDDTAGNERIQIHHHKGSYVEISPDGHITVKGIGNVTNIVDGNLDTIVHGNYSLTVKGTTELYSYGKVTELFKDDRKTTIKGTETLKITGAVKYTFENTLDINIKLATNIKSDAAMTVGGSTISFN